MVRLLLYSLGKFYQELIMLRRIALIKLFFICILYLVYYNIVLYIFFLITY